MAEVYLARASGPRGFEQRVALKLVHAHLRDVEHFASDLIEEAKLAVRIRHPNVVATLDAGESDAGVFLVMEYVEGDSLAGLLATAKRSSVCISRAVRLRILCDALDGLHAAHELRDDDGRLVGLVHRDFSPHNVLVGVDGLSRLGDFGVAKAASRAAHTQSGAVKGKIGYMAPEQARGRPLDRRCDVWAAGVVAWELLADRRLHPSSDFSTLLDIVNEPPPRLRGIGVDISSAMEEAVSRALAMEPRGRWSTAAAFAAALRDASDEIASVAEVAEMVRSIASPSIARLRERVADAAAPSSPRGRVRDHEEDASSGSARPAREARRSSRQRLWPALAAAVGIPAAWIALHRTAPPQVERSSVVDVATAAAASSPAATGSAGPAGPAPFDSAAPAVPATSNETTVIRVTSDAPLARLAVGARTIAVAPGATEIAVALEAGELSKPLRMEGRTATGRRAAVVVAPAARSAELHFGAPPVSTRSRSAERPLARSPYESPK
jgi:serine/threonine-protein kinase